MGGNAMRNFLGIVALAVMTVIWGGCSERGDAMVDVIPGAQLKMIGDFSESTVSRSSSKGEIASVQGETADSLQITRIRTIVSRIKLHEIESDSTDKGRTFKSTPMILVAGADTAYALTAQPVQPGKYDAVKLDIHKLSESDVHMVSGDTNYRDFLENGRATVIVEGRVFKNGATEDFTFYSDATSNLHMKLQPPIRLRDNESGLIALRYDPFMIFKSGATVLDPRDKKNKPHFDKMIKSAIRALKR